MTALNSLSPELVDQLSKAMQQIGRHSLAQQLRRSTVARCTFSGRDLGYLYLVRESFNPQHADRAPVRETISFLKEHGLNVDLDYDGQLFGIEYLDRPDLSRILRAAYAP
ncbi:hypothetical protein [Ideonella sp.]|jgi:hypothetical protein|uniref:hypothetical protein n=1 Tax=Ideonella sp. TaxID=1929293 RepID=UPI0037BFD6F4